MLSIGAPHFHWPDELISLAIKSTNCPPVISFKVSATTSYYCLHIILLANAHWWVVKSQYHNMHTYAHRRAVHIVKIWPKIPRSQTLIFYIQSYLFWRNWIYNIKSCLNLFWKQNYVIIFTDNGTLSWYLSIFWTEEFLFHDQYIQMVNIYISKVWHLPEI